MGACKYGISLSVQLDMVYLTSEHKEGVRCKVEHETRYSISTSTHVLFCLLYKHTDNQGRSQNFSKGGSHCFKLRVLT